MCSRMPSGHTLRDEHPLARLATVGPDGRPHVMPVGIYRLDEGLRCDRHDGQRADHDQEVA